MEYISQSYYNTELYHHGVLGQKWGVRRYQNADGSLTAKGRRRYDYTQSESYKNASAGQKRLQTTQYNNTKRRFGEKTANKIEYKVREEGKDRKKEKAKTILKRIAISSAISLGLSFATDYLGKKIFADKIRQEHIDLGKDYARRSEAFKQSASNWKPKEIGEIVDGEFRLSKNVDSYEWRLDKAREYANRSEEHFRKANRY